MNHSELNDINWVQINQFGLNQELLRLRGVLEGYLQSSGQHHTDKTSNPEMSSSEMDGSVTSAHESDSFKISESALSDSDTFSVQASNPEQAMTDDTEVTTELAITRIRELFSLSPFEADLLLLCAAIELDHRIAALCAQVQGDPHAINPNFSLAMAMLENSHWSALLPTAPLRYWQLISLRQAGSNGVSLCFSPLAIDERILHYLTGLSYLDERLSAIARPLYETTQLTHVHQQIQQQIISLWVNRDSREVVPVIQLHGIESADILAIASVSCQLAKQQALLIEASDLPQLAIERRLQARLWDRESILSPVVLLIRLDESDGRDIVARTMAFVDACTVPIIILSREPLTGSQRVTVRLEVARPMMAEQRQLWLSHLGSAAQKLNGELDLISNQFNLNSAVIRDVCTQALSVSSNDKAHDEVDNIGTVLWQACRSQARPQLDELAERIEPRSCWKDIVLPALQLNLLRDIAAHVRHRNKVYQQWGFADKSSRGLGISALFSGVSGTGKTMAAEVLAQELDLDLYRIDLSSVVSKYIGETEKNLRRVFDAAESGSSILLFDEADALFGKRSDVKDSHDRYANIEVSYLLQRMESFTGLAILTTNMKSALDQAFLRRIRFVVQFPFPEPVQRVEIWRGIYPPQTPRGELDMGKLSRLNIAGGNIRNIALNAAFLAAEDNAEVGMAYLLQATQSEFIKLEKSLTDSEIRGWV